MLQGRKEMNSLLSRRSAIWLPLGWLALTQRAKANSFFCAESLPYDTQVYPVSLDDFEDLVNEGKIHEQGSAETCWAAAIHAKLVYHGVDVTEEEVLQHVRGKVRGNAGAGTVREIIRGLRPASTGWSLNTGDSRMLVMDLQA